MIYQVRFTGDARTQLASIHNWIETVVDRASADVLMLALIDRCEKLREMPFIGSPRDDIRPGLRTLAFRRRYTIGYRVDDAVVTILGVIGRGQRTEDLVRRSR